MPSNIIQASIVTALIVLGSFFLLVGTIGLLRLPDVYNRMHATSKATTLGAASLFLAGFVYFDAQAAGLTSLVGIVFLFLTAPTGAHMISRSAQKMGVEFEYGATWPGEIDSRPDQPADTQPESDPSQTAESETESEPESESESQSQTDVDSDSEPDHGTDADREQSN